MSAQLAIAEPRRMKATHRRRRKVTAGHFVQRYYDPGIGRFLSNDPISTNPNTGASFNRYVYASGNPFRNIDPDGRGDFDLFQPQEGLAVTAARFDIPNWFTSMGHGGQWPTDSEQMFRDDRSSSTPFHGPRLTGGDLASLIRPRLAASDKGVFLGQCGAGKSGPAIARQLQTNVMATKGFVRTIPNNTSGSITYTANMGHDGKGAAAYFNVYAPDGRITARYSSITMRPNGSVWGTLVTTNDAGETSTKRVKIE